MHSLKRRPRRWHLSSKAMMGFIAIPVIAASTFDGVNYREIAALLLVLACGMLVARRADSLQARLDQLEKRLHIPKR